MKIINSFKTNFTPLARRIVLSSMHIRFHRIPPTFGRKVWGRVIFFSFLASCQSIQPVIEDLQKEETACKTAGGAFVLGRGCVMPGQSAPVTEQQTTGGGPAAPPPPVDPPPPPPPPYQTPPREGASACQALGHTSPALFQKQMDSPARQFVVVPAELGGRTLARGRLTAEVTGFGDLAKQATDSFFLLIETVRPGTPYRVVFSGDTWSEGENMWTRWTAQHFPTGARSPRKEPMDQFEHWLHPSSRYLYDCQWGEKEAVCSVAEVGAGWSATTHTPILASLGALAAPLVFGDQAAGAYQSMGPDAKVLRACLSIY